jgi:hypothetical protein
VAGWVWRCGWVAQVGAWAGWRQQARQDLGPTPGPAAACLGRCQAGSSAQQASGPAAATHLEVVGHLPVHKDVHKQLAAGLEPGGHLRVGHGPRAAQAKAQASRRGYPRRRATPALMVSLQIAAPASIWQRAPASRQRRQRRQAAQRSTGRAGRQRRKAAQTGSAGRQAIKAGRRRSPPCAAAPGSSSCAQTSPLTPRGRSALGA